MVIFEYKISITLIEKTAFKTPINETIALSPGMMISTSETIK